MTTQNAASFALRLQGVVDPSVPRAFGSVTTEIRDTTRRIEEARSEQQRLTRELRGVKRGTTEYDQLEQQVNDTKNEVSRLTVELDQQQGSWDRYNRNTRRLGVTTGVLGGVIGAAAGATILATNELSEYSRQVLLSSRNTGLAVDDIQRLDNVFRFIGRDIDATDYNEFNIRLGEVRTELAAGEKSARAQAEALRALGFDLNTVSAKDIPQILARLREASPELQSFFSDEIFGGTLGEAFRLAFDLPEDIFDDLSRARTLSEDQIETFTRLGARTQLVGQDVRLLSAGFAGAMTPAVEGTLNVLSPLVSEFAEFSQTNPEVIRGLAGATIGITALTGALYAGRAAYAAYRTGIIRTITAQVALRAVQGPVGWGILAAAGVALAAAGIGGYVLGNRLFGGGDSQTEEAEDRFAEKTGEQVTMGVKQVADNLQTERRDNETRLNNILRVLECSDSPADPADPMAPTTPRLSLGATIDADEAADAAEVVGLRIALERARAIAALPPALRDRELGNPSGQYNATFLPYDPTIANNTALPPLETTADRDDFLNAVIQGRQDAFSRGDVYYNDVQITVTPTPEQDSTDVAEEIQQAFANLVFDR